MRYIGGKSLLVPAIKEIVEQNCPDAKSFLDVFAGSTVVSRAFKPKFKVFCNDYLYFSYCIARGTIGTNINCQLASSIISTLNHIKPIEGFIWANYSPAGGRKYFTEKNAAKIDAIRIYIEEKFEGDEYFFALASLLNAVPYIANITGTYAAFLKYWDKRALMDITLNTPLTIDGEICSCYNMDYTNALNLKTDILYADPPYNSREYLPNYHILETIARYDSPAIHGITGLREYNDVKSPFCKKKDVKQAFVKLLSLCQSKYIIISYNNEGIISKSDLYNICNEFGRLLFYEYPYRKYKNKIPSLKSGLMEHIYFIQRF